MKNYPILFKSFILLFLVGTSGIVLGQAMDRVAFEKAMDELPYFSVFRSNYFISGVPTNTTIERTTADAKYQISFKQFIIKDQLPWDTYAYASYTQKSFWNIYDESLPFQDINFNPAISLGKPVYNNKDELKGFATLSFEHESNGRDSIASRSWNRFTASYVTNVGKNTKANFKAWLPFAYGEGNPDLLEYVGLGEINLDHKIIADRFYVNMRLRKGLNFDGKGSVRTRIFFNPFKVNRSDQYMMLEWFVGQAEGLLNYTESSSYIRIGYVIKTTEFDFFR
jgi:phospholipase A1